MAIKIYYLAKRCYKLHLSIINRFFELILRYMFGIEIYSRMQCGNKLRLPHNGLGVVINPNAVVGNNVTIHQNVTIGGRNGSGCPIIRDNVSIGAGAVLLGDITIGDGAEIGANAVVINDVPEDTIAVGVPAVIKEKRGNRN